MNGLISTLELYFGQKAPQIPANIKEIIVKIAPYLTILGVLSMASSSLAMLGLSPAFRMYGAYVGGGFGIAAILNIVMLVLYIMAVPGLFKRQASGWNFTFYALLISAIAQIIWMNLVGLVISLVIGFWILFQIKSYYFGGSPMSSGSSNPMMGL